MDQDQNNLTKKRNVDCLICTKLFASNTSLKVHIKTVHENLKPFDCKLCTSTFGRRHGLTKHIETVHETL